MNDPEGGETLEQVMRIGGRRLYLGLVLGLIAIAGTAEAQSGPRVFTISNGSNDLTIRQDGVPDIFAGNLLSAPFQIVAFSMTSSNFSSFDAATHGFVWIDSATDAAVGSTGNGVALPIAQLAFLNGNDIVGFEIDNHTSGPTDLFAVLASGGIPGDTVFTGSGGTFLTCLSAPSNPCETDQITGLFDFQNHELLYTLNGDTLWFRDTAGTKTLIGTLNTLGFASPMRGLSVVTKTFIEENVPPVPSVQGPLALASLATLLGLSARRGLRRELRR